MVGEKHYQSVCCHTQRGRALLAKRTGAEPPPITTQKTRSQQMSVPDTLNADDSTLTAASIQRQRKQDEKPEKIWARNLL